MAKLIPIGCTGIAALIAGLLLGRASKPEASQRPQSLYLLEVQIVDAETGTPVNASLTFPEGFFGQWKVSDSPGRRVDLSGSGILRTELAPETGECRAFWIGPPDTDYKLRFTADGYEPLLLPPELIHEVACVEGVGGVGKPTVLEIRKLPEVSDEEPASQQQLEESPK